MNKKNKILVLVIAVVIVLIFVLGSSYALWQYSVSLRDANIAGSDCFELTFSEGNAINIGNGIPVSDEDVNDLEPFHFTIKNICNSVMDYNINIETLSSGEDAIDLDAIASKVDLNSKQILGSLENNSLVYNSGAVSSKTIFTGVITPDETKEHDVRLWIDESATVEQSANKNFSSKVVVLGTLKHNYVEGPKVTVSFDSSGGVNSSFESKEIEIDSTYGNLPTPSKEGYSFLGWASGYILPRDYQAVEYIESNGNQYIDTKIVPTNTMGMYGKLSSTDVSTDLIYFGSKYGGANRFWIGNQGYKIYYGWNTNTFSSFDLVPDEINIIKMNYLNDRKSMFNDVLLKDIGDEVLKNNTYSIHIFGGNDTGAAASYRSKIKLYEFRITDGEEITNLFVPCYRKIDNEIGLYDIVNDVFYKNKGSGAFTKGSDVVNEFVTSSTQVISDENHTLYAIWGHNPTVTFEANGGSVNPTSKNYSYDSNYTNLPIPTKAGYTFLGWKDVNDNYNLPNDYQEVEYVESTGDQYIELPFGFDRSDKVFFDVSIDEGYTDDKYMVSPSTWNDSFKNRFAMGGVGPSSNYFTIGFANRSTTTSSLTPNMHNDGGRHQWNYENSIFTISDLNISYDGTSATFDRTTTNLRLFYGYNSTNKGKIYRYTHWKNNEKVIDLIPCYRKSDNEIGLYDIVNDIFYTKQGSESFKKGSIVANQFITSSTKMILNTDHTLYAIWENE